MEKYSNTFKDKDYKFYFKSNEQTQFIKFLKFLRLSQTLSILIKFSQIRLKPQPKDLKYHLSLCRKKEPAATGSRKYPKKLFPTGTLLQQK